MQLKEDDQIIKSKWDGRSYSVGNCQQHQKSGTFKSQRSVNEAHSVFVNVSSLHPIVTVRSGCIKMMADTIGATCWEC